MQLIATSGSLSILQSDDMFPLALIRAEDAKDIAAIWAHPRAAAGTYAQQVEGVSSPGL